MTSACCESNVVGLGGGGGGRWWWCGGGGGGCWWELLLLAVPSPPVLPSPLTFHGFPSVILAERQMHYIVTHPPGDYKCKHQKVIAFDEST